MNLSGRWLQNEFQEAFNASYKDLLRTIWVYQAVKLLQKTDLDNTDIALELNYKELSSMDRDFKTILNLSPNEVREKLGKVTIDKLFEI
jgi:transcriptional regulator GlxA family with amidase domain